LFRVLNGSVPCSWTTFALTVVIGTVTYWAKADDNPYVWGDNEARKQLEAEGVI
jgi:hypothetical protein